MNPALNPDDATIRPVQPPDRAAVLTITHTSGLFPDDELDDIAATLDQYLAGTSTNDRWIIASDSTEPVGIAYYAPERMTNGTWNLYMLAIDANHHRQGHGAALVNHVEHDLRASRNARLLLIETSGVPEFAGQRAFYAQLGYHLEARIRDFYDIGDDKIIYRKALPPPPTDRRLPTTSPNVNPALRPEVQPAREPIKPDRPAKGGATQTHQGGANQP